MKVTSQMRSPTWVTPTLDELSGRRLKTGGRKHDEVGAGVGLERFRDRFTAHEGLSIVTAERNSGLNESERVDVRRRISLRR
jgi:hypothetical protein